MSFAREFHMPGAYQYDPTPAATSSQALSAGIFRPPVSPDASSYNLARSTGSLFSDMSMSTTPAAGAAKRKRMSTRESTPVEWNMNMDGAHDMRDEDRTQGAGRQIRYTLAGQINTTPAGPPHGAECGILEDSIYSDVDYRRALGPKRICSDLDLTSGRLTDAHPSQSTQNTVSSPGWSAFAFPFQTIGGVMGKVWEFCTKGAFRGFHAGVGDGYEVRGPSPTASQTGKPWSNEPDIPTLESEETLVDPEPPEPSPHASYPQAGYPPAYPQPSYSQTSYFQPEHKAYSPEYRETSTPDSTPRPAVKRRQVSENDELRRNWVLVEDEPVDAKPRSFAAAVAAAPPRPGAPRNRNSSYSSPIVASNGRRISMPVSRISGSIPNSAVSRSRASLHISHAGSPQMSLRGPASFASPRSPVSRVTPSRIPIPAQQSSHQQQHHLPSPMSRFGFPGGTAAYRPSSRQSPRVQSPVMSMSPSKVSTHRRRQSAASIANISARRTMTDQIDPDDIQASPRLDAEAKQLAQKKLEAEQDTDMLVDAFNARLLNMIRQGKEALGTTVEVLDEGDGDGAAAAGAGAGTWEDDDIL
ncbi:hypothetical protein B0T22DRAFT_136565 [Podospora appendiculata]|uniref:Uncharacterized protein n=1 Tax=Podospora appendiculata TaxID=314037 RepID=A0AAE0X8M2_9PEZI|nr:hypothetical protein B0T22DRAFT_136565 [Podospora appendiculata]